MKGGKSGHTRSNSTTGDEEKKEEKEKSKSSKKKKTSWLGGLRKPKEKYVIEVVEETTATVPLWGITLGEENWNVVYSFVQACIKWMVDNGAKDNVGVFRKAGVESKILELKEQTSRGDFQFSPDEDCHAISNLLKRFFRELVEPLLTFDLYEALIAADAEKKDQRLSTICTVLSMLPKFNIKLLKLTCEYLHQVAAHCEINLMQATNLAIVFAPNFLRPEKETPLKLISDAGHAANLVTTLIEDTTEIFQRVRSEPNETQRREEVRRTLRLNYTLLRDQSKAAAKQLMQERQMDEEELHRTMELAGKNIKEGRTNTIKIFFEDESNKRNAHRNRTQLHLLFEDPSITVDAPPKIPAESPPNIPLLVNSEGNPNRSVIIDNKNSKNTNNGNNNNNSNKNSEKKDDQIIENKVDNENNGKTETDKDKKNDQNNENKTENENDNDDTGNNDNSEKSPNDTLPPSSIPSFESIEPPTSARRKRAGPSKVTRIQRQYSTWNGEDHTRSNSQGKLASISPTSTVGPKKGSFTRSHSNDIENVDLPSLTSPPESPPPEPHRRKEKDRSHRKTIHRPHLHILRDLAEQVQIEEKRKSLKLDLQNNGVISAGIDLIYPTSQSARGPSPRRDFPVEETKKVKDDMDNNTKGTTYY